jgi:hypothetical protein
MPVCHRVVARLALAVAMVTIAVSLFYNLRLTGAGSEPWETEPPASKAAKDDYAAPVRMALMREMETLQERQHAAHAVIGSVSDLDGLTREVERLEQRAQEIQDLYGRLNAAEEAIAGQDAGSLRATVIEEEARLGQVERLRLRRDSRGPNSTDTSPGEPTRDGPISRGGENTTSAARPPLPSASSELATVLPNLHGVSYALPAKASAYYFNLPKSTGRRAAMEATFGKLWGPRLKRVEGRLGTDRAWVSERMIPMVWPGCEWIWCSAFMMIK